MVTEAQEQLANTIYESYVDSEGEPCALPLEKAWKDLLALSGGGIAVECDLDRFFRDAIEYTIQKLDHLGYSLTEPNLLNTTKTEN